MDDVFAPRTPRSDSSCSSSDVSGDRPWIRERRRRIEAGLTAGVPSGRLHHYFQKKCYGHIGSSTEVIQPRRTAPGEVSSVDRPRFRLERPRLDPTGRGPVAGSKSDQKSLQFLTHLKMGEPAFTFDGSQTKAMQPYMEDKPDPVAHMCMRIHPMGEQTKQRNALISTLQVEHKNDLIDHSVHNYQQDKKIYTKVRQTATGENFYSVAGGEDLLPPATQPIMGCDLQPSDTYMVMNDKRFLPYFERQGPGRPNNTQLQSSRSMFKILQPRRVETPVRPHSSRTTTDGRGQAAGLAARRSPDSMTDRGRRSPPSSAVGGSEASFVSESRGSDSERGYVQTPDASVTVAESCDSRRRPQPSSSASEISVLERRRRSAPSVGSSASASELPDRAARRTPYGGESASEVPQTARPVYDRRPPPADDDEGSSCAPPPLERPHHGRRSPLTDGGGLEVAATPQSARQHYGRRSPGSVSVASVPLSYTSSVMAENWQPRPQWK